jgi:hypothetical protein
MEKLICCFCGTEFTRKEGKIKEEWWDENDHYVCEKLYQCPKCRAIDGEIYAAEERLQCPFVYFKYKEG